MISNNVPTTAPLMTATLTESLLSLDGTLDTTVTAQATHVTYLRYYHSTTLASYSEISKLITIDYWHVCIK